jgi:cysteine desulfurase
MTDYLDCNATTPVDPRVQAEILRYLEIEFGNPASPHDYGKRAKAAVQSARDRIAAVVAARRHEVFFTSGATESNNLALLGLAPYGADIAKRHIVSTQIEHHAVLEPLAELRRRGFQVTLVPPDRDGRVAAAAVVDAIRPDTLLVSMMHVNNETGVAQPVAETADALVGQTAFFHVDAAQGFGKDIDALRHSRIDLISISGHKIYGPKGIGALIARRRAAKRPPLQPLQFGGGQELGLRPGTLAVPLIAGLGAAAELALAEWPQRAERCRRIRERLLAALARLSPVVHGSPRFTLPHVLNLSLPGVDSDDAIAALESVAAVSNGSACTSVCATRSHVLAAMGVPPELIDSALRLSWCHVTKLANLEAMIAVLRRLQQGSP